jgi:hypothetical protein
MEYRKKHLKPKKNLASDLQQTFLRTDDILDEIDFFQDIRKQAF